MIRFITTETPQKELTFGDVEINQFFVDRDSDLCQKTTGSSYCVIAHSDGRPESIMVEGMNTHGHLYQTHSPPSY